MCVSIYIYIYRERERYIHTYLYIYIERERERERCIHIHTYICVNMCIYIYIYSFVARALEPSPWRRIWGDHAGKARGGVSGRKRPRHRGGAIRPDGRCAQREKGKGGECPGWRSEPNIGTVAGEARKRRWKRARLLGAVLAASRRSLLDCHVAGLLGADGARGGGSPKS